MTSAAISLTKMNTPYTLFHHKNPIHSLEEAAQERNQKPEQIVRSILFRLGKEQYATVLVAGPGQISWKALRHHLGRSRLTMASPEEVLTVIGYRVGAISPFGLPCSIPIFVDESALAQDEVSIGSGERGTAVVMLVSDLMSELRGIEVGRFAA